MGFYQKVQFNIVSYRHLLVGGLIEDFLNLYLLESTWSKHVSLPLFQIFNKKN